MPEGKTSGYPHLIQPFHKSQGEPIDNICISRETTAMMTRKVKERSDTRSVPIPDEQWDGLEQLSRKRGGTSKAALIREAIGNLLVQNGYILEPVDQAVEL